MYGQKTLYCPKKKFEGRYSAFHSKKEEVIEREVKKI
jgi:hypothetical protein